MKRIQLFLVISLCFIISGCKKLDQVETSTKESQEKVTNQLEEKELDELKKELSDLEAALSESEKNLSELEELGETFGYEITSEETSSVSD